MRDRLAEDMRPVTIARDAMRAIGIEPTDRPIRGGTDGSILTARGLPTPNIFSGAHNCHGPFEWVTLEEMEKAVFLCAEIAKLWGKETRTSNDS